MGTELRSRKLDLPDFGFKPDALLFKRFKCRECGSLANQAHRYEKAALLGSQQIGPQVDAGL